MDLFKIIKDLKVYKKDLSTLFEGITQNGKTVKIGKYKIVGTPSEEAAKRLYERLRTTVENELTEVSNTYDKIENTIDSIQVDMFKYSDEEHKEEVKPKKDK